jgi:hypothetical protein
MQRIISGTRLSGLLVLALVVGGHAARAQQQATPAPAPTPAASGAVVQAPEADQMLTYSRGQAVIPAYEGWTPRDDGTIDLWFGYLNQNYREEPDIPVGPNNFITPAKYAMNVLMATHFLPRNNRWVVKVNVPKDFPEKEVIWTLTSHGKTYRAYGTLHPGYIKDASGLQREYFGEPPPEGNDPPTIAVEGSLSRTVKVGEASLMRITVKDDGIPRAGGPFPPGARPGQNNQNNLLGRRTSICGTANAFFCGEPNEGAGALASVKGLRMNCFLLAGGPEKRGTGDFGNGGLLTFDPPQEKAWEDHRGNSPWAAGYRLPAVPKDGVYEVKASFAEPGAYVVRCQANDGQLTTNKEITFDVSR